MVLPNCVLQVWNTRTTPSKGSLNKTNAWVLLRILQFKCLSLDPSRVVLLTLENCAHFSQIACRQLAFVTNGWRKFSGEFALHCLHSIGYSLDSVFIFWIHFWCMVPAMQKPSLYVSERKYFIQREQSLLHLSLGSLILDKVFSLFSLSCKWIDLSMEWLRSAWIHVLKTFNVGA